MKAIYYNTKDRWADYWKVVGEDKDMLDRDSYPLFPAIQYLKQSRHLNKSGRVLEAGCGLGRLAKWLKHDQFDVTALELEEYSIGKLKKDTPGMKCVRADICKLPFRDKSFVFIFLMGVIDVFSDNLKRESSVSEVKRVLQQDGVVFISVPHSGSLFWFIYSLRRNNILRRLFGKPVLEQHVGQYAFSSAEIKALMNKYFKDLKINYVNCRMSYFYVFPFFRSRDVRGVSFPELQRKERNLGESVYKLNLAGELLFPLLLRILKRIISPTLYVVIRK